MDEQFEGKILNCTLGELEPKMSSQLPVKMTKMMYM